MDILNQTKYDQKRILLNKILSSIKQCSDQAKANIFFDGCCLFFDLFRFRIRFRSVWTGP